MEELTKHLQLVLAEQEVATAYMERIDAFRGAGMPNELAATEHTASQELAAAIRRLAHHAQTAQYAQTPDPGHTSHYWEHVEITLEVLRDRAVSVRRTTGLMTDEGWRQQVEEYRQQAKDTETIQA